MESQSFEIVGFGGATISAQLTRHGGTGLSVFLPGLRYKNDLPLLYFTRKLLVEHGYDELTFDYRYYDHAAFLNAPDQEKGAWLKADAEAVMSAVSSIGDANRLAIVGKSIGTALMVHLIPRLSHHHAARLIWLTPLPAASSELLKMSERRHVSLLAIGTSDPGYDAEVVARFAGQGHTVEVFEGLDHSLEKPGKVADSVAALSRLLAALDQWLAR